MAYVFFFGWGVCRAGETFLGVTKKNPTQNTQNKKKKVLKFHLELTNR